MESVSGVQYVDTIQRVPGGRKIVPDKTPRGAEAPLGVPPAFGESMR